MFRLASPDLPTIAKSHTTPAPIARTYWGSRRYLAPIALINVLANYGVELGLTINLPLPLFIGSYFRIDLGYEILSAAIDNFIIQSSPLSASPNQGWIDGNTINLLIDGRNRTEYENLTITAKARLSVPVPVNNSYVLSVPNTFAAIAIEYEGVRLEPDVFSQVGNQLTINPTSHNLRVGTELFVAGIQTIALPEQICAFLVFELQEIVYLDAINFMGTSFTPSTNALSPQTGEFLWNDLRLWATLFISSERANGLTAATPVSLDYSSNVSQLSY